MQKLTTEEVKRRLDSGDDLIFIDARSADSWSTADQQIPKDITQIVYLHQTYQTHLTYQAYQTRPSH